MQLPADDDGYIAYCLDQAVGHVGMTIQNELDEVEGKKDEVKAKHRLILDRYFGIDSSEAPGRFADPAMFFKT